MDKTIAGLLGAAAALTTLTVAHATPAPAPAASYADLLAPVPDALAVQKADDAARAVATSRGELQLARVFVRHRNHHHHHHHHHRGFHVGPLTIGPGQRHHHHHYGHHS